MAVVGGFRSDLSITRKTDGNFQKAFSRVFCFPKSRINGNGGNIASPVFSLADRTLEKATLDPGKFDLGLVSGGSNWVEQ